MAQTFENDLERLEAIVQALESGELALDESLKRFEEGVKLTKRCEKALTEAEKRIETLTRNENGELEAEPFGEISDAGRDSTPAASDREPAHDSADSATQPASGEEEEDDDPDDEEDGSLLF